MSCERQTIDGLLRESRARLDRLTPEHASAAMDEGALLIDIRAESQREADGVVPGSLFIARNVLEWRVNPPPATSTHPSAASTARSSRCVTRATNPA
jgi:hypothetical protein